MAEKPKHIDFKYNLKVYFSFLKKYKLLFSLILFILLINEASYIADRFVFKYLIDNGTDFSNHLITKQIFLEFLIGLLIVYFSILIARVTSKWFFLHFLNKLEGNLIYDLKIKTFNHIIGLSHKFFTSNKTGSLISRSTRGGRAIERVTDVIVFNTAPLIFQLIMVSGSLMLFDFLSGLIVLATVFSFIGFSVFIHHIQRKSMVIANDTDDYEKARLADFFMNIDSVKYFGRETHVKSEFKNIIEHTKKAILHNWNYFRWLDAGQSLILGIGVFFLIYFPLTKFINGEITIGTLVFIYTVYGSLVNPMFGFVRGIRDFFSAMADFESLFQYYKIENEIKDRQGAQTIQITGGSVQFKEITFNYPSRKMFENFSLKIPKGKKVAFVGHSGSGKTTLVKLLYRLYDVKSGAILIDGKNINEFKQESLRSEMSIVPQECILFDDTIYNNIAFSKPDASKEEVFAAIKFAQLDGIIDEFPKKENTIVGERGVKLSGGEKQRVSIARAILANKKILVLDEATSALDSQTEHDIQESLKKLMHGRTSIIIAHRLSTIMSADKIVVLKKGQIVQMGTHKELIRKKGEYKKLWDLQKGGYIK